MFPTIHILETCFLSNVFSLDFLLYIVEVYKANFSVRGKHAKHRLLIETRQLEGQWKIRYKIFNIYLCDSFYCTLISYEKTKQSSELIRVKNTYR